MKITVTVKVKVWQEKIIKNHNFEAENDGEGVVEDENDNNRDKNEIVLTMTIMSIIPTMMRMIFSGDSDDFVTMVVDDDL